MIWSQLKLNTSVKVRDISMSLTGLRNMRMFDSSDCVTSLLTEDDWDEPGSTTSHMHLFSPITRQQKLYMIEISKLSLIGKGGNVEWEFLTWY